MEPLLQQRLQTIKKEYAKTQRKLQKSERAARAKAHVKKKLKEQAALSATEQRDRAGTVEHGNSNSPTEPRLNDSPDPSLTGNKTVGHCLNLKTSACKYTLSDDDSTSIRHSDGNKSTSKTNPTLNKSPKKSVSGVKAKGVDPRQTVMVSQHYIDPGQSPRGPSPSNLESDKDFRTASAEGSEVFQETRSSGRSVLTERVRSCESSRSLDSDSEDIFASQSSTGGTHCDTLCERLDSGLSANTRSLPETINRKLARKAKCGTAGSRRQSPRMSDVNSSQKSLSHSDSSPSLSLPLLKSLQKSKKQLMISSIFQCLVDEGQREKRTNEFALPRMYQKLMDLRLSECTREDNERSPSQIAGCVNVENIEAVKDLRNHHKDMKEDNNNFVVTKDICETKSDRDDVDVAPTVSLVKTRGLDSAPGDRATPRSHRLRIDTDTNSSSLQSDFSSTPMSPALFGSQLVSSPSYTCSPLQSGTCTSLRDSEEYDSPCLLQTGVLQIEKKDEVVNAVTVDLGGQSGACVVCLSVTAVRFFRCLQSKWECVYTHKFAYPMKKGWCPCLHLVRGEPDQVTVLLQQTQTDRTQLTLFTCRLSGQSTLNVIPLDTVMSKRLIVCSVDGTVFIAHYIDQKTNVTKYRMDTGHRHQLETVTDHISCLTTVQGLDSALLGLSAASSMLYIWNHMTGALLTSVDMNDVCSQESLCCTGFFEEGFLFVPLIFKKRSKQAGVMLIVNPHLGTSETLYSLQSRQGKWSGCTNLNLHLLGEDRLLGRENSGAVHVWDVHSGQLLAYIKDVNFTSVFAHKDSLLFIHKQCVHMYHYLE